MAAPRDEKADPTKARYEAIRERYRPSEDAKQNPQAQQRPQAQQWMPETPFGGGVETADDAGLEAEEAAWRGQIVEQFRTGGRRADAELEQLLADALRYASPAPEAGEFVVSLRAIATSLAAAIDRLRGRSAPVPESAKDWAALQGWLDRHLPVPTPPSPAQLEKLWLSARGSMAVISISTRNRLLPALDKMAGNDALGVRHLVRAVGSGLIERGKLETAGWPAGLEPTIELADLLDRLARFDAPGRQPAEDTPVLEDKPATVDLLGRKPVASVLA